MKCLEAPMIKKLVQSFFLMASITLFSFEDPEVDTDGLYKLWMVRGRYSSMTVNDVHFPGTRPWKVRWELIKNGVDFSDKKVIDLGTNIGICPTFIAKYTDASSVVGIDRNVEFAKQFQGFFHVSFPLMTIDLDSDSYEEVLGYDYDLVICMSVYNWVNKKEKLLNYLSHFNEVLYEGHQKDEIELARFKEIGFHNAVFLGKTDRKRSLFLFSK